MKQFRELFKELLEHHRTLLDTYQSISSLSRDEAFNLAGDTLLMADKWAEIELTCKEVAVKEGLNKTDISAYVHKKHQIMRECHTHCRMIWNSGG